MDATTHGQQTKVHFLLIQEGIMGGNDTINWWFIASGEYLDILFAWSAVKPQVAVLTLVHPEDYFYKLENWNQVRSQTQKKFMGRKAKLLFVSRVWMLAKDYYCSRSGSKVICISPGLWLLINYVNNFIQQSLLFPLEFWPLELPTNVYGK